MTGSGAAQDGSGAGLGSGAHLSTSIGSAVIDSVGAPDATPDIRIVGGNPTADEVAALTAVIAGVIEQVNGEDDRRLARGPSAWQRSQRPIRAPMYPGAGHWRGFSG